MEDENVDCDRHEGTNTEEAPPAPSSRMFFTTTDLLERMNAAVAEATGDDDENDGRPAGFELQRRMPDGSTRRADDADLAAADIQTKIKQAGAMVAGLSSEEKVEWAKAQRLEGNALFAREEYTEAMDVYITCLVAMETVGGKTQADGNGVESDNADHDEQGSGSGTHAALYSEEVERDIQLPVLLNLSLCSLKLGMLRKAETFCNFAIETSSGRTFPKAYFRRGRARLLMGSYDEARTDLETSLELMERKEGGESGGVAGSAEKDAVLKEMQKLERLERSSRQNRIRQKTAMKRVLGGESLQSNSNSDRGGDATSGGDVGSGSQEDRENMSSPACPSQAELPSDDGLYKDVRQRRAYSNLRAIKPTEEDEGDNEDDGARELSFFQWYRSLVERCLRKTLRMLGDEEGAELYSDHKKE